MHANQPDQVSLASLMETAALHTRIRELVTAVLVGVFTMVLTLPVQANSDILAAFQNFYPDSRSDENAGVRSCQLCHENSGKPALLNVYGRLLSRSGSDFALLESFPSVNINGGTSMLDEINAGTQPGWTTGANNDVYTINNLYDPFGPPVEPPLTITGPLDPDAPPGQEVFPWEVFMPAILHAAKTQKPPMEPRCASGCAVEEFCRTPEGSCGAGGVCEARPEFCIEIYNPVCGCDGITYSNACYARSSGVSIDYVGECTQ